MWRNNTNIPIDSNIHRLPKSDQNKNRTHRCRMYQIVFCASCLASPCKCYNNVSSDGGWQKKSHCGRHPLGCKSEVLDSLCSVSWVDKFRHASQTKNGGQQDAGSIVSSQECYYYISSVLVLRRLQTFLSGSVICC